ncbi:MAG: PadR family transcriptional regulator [Anaerovoracaceae bacterium]|jgi:DNA-binding PadR family transcriptional regulator
MAKKSLEPLTETMFYVLLALDKESMYGTEIAGYIKALTRGRVVMGPGTLYTILSNFQKEKLIQKTGSEGRRIIYRITEKGKAVYEEEILRLTRCLADVKKESKV